VAPDSGLCGTGNQVGVGHDRPVTLSKQPPFERRLRSETCRISYFRSSATTGHSYKGKQLLLSRKSG